MKIAVIMDLIDFNHPQKNTSFAILLAAQKRGFEIYYLESQDLTLQKDIPYGHYRRLRVMDNKTPCFDFLSHDYGPLSQFDMIFMRKDPPKVDPHYAHAVQILTFVDPQKTRVINRPESLLLFNEKLLSLHFPELCPPTLVSAIKADIVQFIEMHGDMICKPLEGMGGYNVFRLHTTYPNLNATLEMLTQRETLPIVCSRYIPEVKAGDKRIILINGEVIPYGLARIPAPNETRANLAAGGTGHVFKLNEKDLYIAQSVAPFLKSHGLCLVGLDVIGEYLTEINISSPTCIRQIEAETQIDICGKLLTWKFLG